MKKQTMKKSLNWALAALLPLAASAPAMASVSVDRLSTEVDQLVREAQYARLDYRTENDVQDLAVRVSSLSNCERQASYSDPYGRGSTLPVQQCTYQAQDVQSSFQLVDNEIRMQPYADSQLLAQLDRTRQAMDNVAYDYRLSYGGGGGVGTPPMGGMLQAVGSLDGISFNLAGNRTVDIDQQCLQLGYRWGIRSVRVVYVNGQTIQFPSYGGAYTLENACHVVSSHARQGSVITPLPGNGLPDRRPVPVPPIPRPRHP
jgi:hypothetical protein